MEEEEEESEEEDDSFGPKKAKEEESDDPVVRKFSFRPSRWWRHIMHCWWYYFCSVRIFRSTKCILCPFAVYFVRYKVRLFFTMSRIFLVSGTIK